MYAYSDFDQNFVDQRAKEFADQVARRLDGRLTEDEFKPLRLQNGLYLQLHAYMLRVAIPYGTLSAVQMRTLGNLADKYDRGYGHFTTRQNIQYNWPALQDIPAMLAELAAVQMHAIQTSGNCIRNVTSDPFAGAAADEWADPRPTAELLRQWSSLHPEFLYLPRKFKLAIIGAAEDRAAVAAHDIGLVLKVGEGGALEYQVWAGGGQGRTPRLAQLLAEHVAELDLIPYLEAIMRVYNAYGRRDNKYKARIKILVEETGIDTFRDQVNAEFAAMDKAPFAGIEAQFSAIKARFSQNVLPPAAANDEEFDQAQAQNPDFARWVKNNLSAHKNPGYAVVSISIKAIGEIPGDVTGEQMRVLADLGEKYSQSELRITHRQNVVLPFVKKSDLLALYRGLSAAGLASGNIGEATDIIACPGLDYCALATARSIPVAQSISKTLAVREEKDQIGKLTINLSGCINACGHHHVANIGVLGLEKNGEEFYQITIGGASNQAAAIGKIAGRGLSQEEVPGAINRLIDCYVEQRQDAETFNETYHRIGLEPFKESLYALPA